MKSVVHVAIHCSQSPENVRRDLLESLRSRQVNHKFHYDSIKQTHQWLTLHELYSPARTDPDCAAIYDRSFKEATARIAAHEVHVISLGCGGGEKDARLLKQLKSSGKDVFYTPSDVSVAMVLVAREAVTDIISPGHCLPLVCDLATAEDLPSVLDEISNERGPAFARTRLLTFFGMIPNFEPNVILPRIASLVRSQDLLLLSANLAPGPDYATGVRRVLPLYDNEPTREWLMMFLYDLGVEKGDGELHFVTENDPAKGGLKRITAYFKFTSPRTLQVHEQVFDFRPGETVRLFFSYRHTPDLMRTLLAEQGLTVLDHWVTRSEEEGVFLACRR